MVFHQLLFAKIQGYDQNQKLEDAACQLKQLEPNTPWSNVAEREMKELEKGASHKLLLSRAFKHLWQDCMELEVYIRSNTVHNIDTLAG